MVDLISLAIITQLICYISSNIGLIAFMAESLNLAISAILQLIAMQTATTSQLTLL
jgi:hypothetical protein